MSQGSPPDPTVDSGDVTVELRSLSLKAAVGVFAVRTGVAFRGSTTSVAAGGVLDPVTLKAAGVVGPLPSVSVGGVLVTGDRVHDGVLIISVTAGWLEFIRRFNADPKEMYQVDPRLLEEIVAGAIRQEGLFDDVVLTPRSGDFGRDVIATKRGRYPMTLIAEVKRYGPEEVVTAEQVSAFVNHRAVNLRLTNALYTTTCMFAPKLREDPRIAPYLASKERGRDAGSLTLVEGAAAMAEWFKELSEKDRK